MNQTVAYMECYPDSSYEAAKRDASRLLTNADLKDEVQRLRELSDEGDVMTRRFKREELKKDVKKKDIEYKDKHRAIEIDNKMSGDNEPEQVQHNLVINWGDEGE